MTALLLFPKRYGLTKGIEQALITQNIQVIVLDHNEILSKFEKKIKAHTFRLNQNLRARWNYYIFKKVNEWYKKKILELKPDLIIIYNHKMLHPELAKLIKQKNIKLAFYLGDSPFYSFTSDYYLELLDYADAIFSPDSFWKIQLEKIGLTSIYFMPVNISDSEYFNKGEIIGKKGYELDAVYIGTNYKNSWGYKKARFLHYFASTNLKIIGDNGWKKWFANFPDLEKHFHQKSGYIPVSEVNNLYNASKVIPVDGNPGIMHGLHSRVIEALNAGSLPFMEYNPDMDVVFDGINDLPYVKTYNEIPEKLQFLLNNDQFRQEKIVEMRNAFNKKYSKEKVGNFLLKAILGNE